MVKKITTGTQPLLSNDDYLKMHKALQIEDSSSRHVIIKFINDSLNSIDGLIFGSVETQLSKRLDMEVTHFKEIVEDFDKSNHSEISNNRFINKINREMLKISNLISVINDKLILSKEKNQSFNNLSVNFNYLNNFLLKKEAEFKGNKLKDEVENQSISDQKSSAEVLTQESVEERGRSRVRKDRKKSQVKANTENLNPERTKQSSERSESKGRSESPRRGRSESSDRSVSESKGRSESPRRGRSESSDRSVSESKGRSESPRRGRSESSDRSVSESPRRGRSESPQRGVKRDRSP